MNFPAQRPALTVVHSDDLEVYPLTRADRLDSHFFMPWNRPRWLNSMMRLKGTPEAQLHYLNLIWISFDQSPMGTLPNDIDVLAKLLHTDAGSLQQLCTPVYGALHRWEPCLCEGEVRLFHPVVLETLADAISRKASHRANSDAASARQRLGRLRAQVSGLSPEVASNEAAVGWIDDWLTDNCDGNRTTARVETAMRAWSNHVLQMRRGS